jgi:hypothetical protein
MDLGGYIFMEPLLFLALDYMVEEIHLSMGGWSWLMIVLWFGAIVNHSLDIWILSTSRVIYFLDHPSDYASWFY